MELNNILDYFVLFIIIIKVLFLIFTLLNYLIDKGKLQNIDGVKISYLKSLTEFLFNISMAILLVYHFMPKHKKIIKNETSILFFLYGILTLITADWSRYVNL